MKNFLNSIDLSGRTRNALINAGEGQTEEAFLALTKRQFLSLPGGGEKGWREIYILQEQIRDEFSDAGWATMTSCPYNTPVDLWCVEGNEAFAQHDGGWPVGQVITGRTRHPQHQFFGIDNLAHVPDMGGDVDLIPVAWRLAIPPCPPQLIALVRNIPLTQAEVMEANGDAGRLNAVDISFLHIVQEHVEDAHGWRKMSKDNWPLAKEFRHPELIQLWERQLRVRLTKVGRIVTEYLT